MNNSISKTQQLLLPSGPLYFLQEGSGPDALIVHGDASNLPLLRYQTNALMDIRKISAIAPACSTHVALGSTLLSGHKVNVIEEYLNARGLNKIDLIATDRGVGMALSFASQHPERLRKLILSNCMANPEQTEWVNESLYPDGCLERIEQQKKMIVGNYPQEIVSIENGLQKLNIPVLIVWCTRNDHFNDLWSKWIASFIPDHIKKTILQFDTILSPSESAQQYTRYIRQFLISEFSGFWQQSHKTD